MTELPQNLDQAVDQAQIAVKAAMADGFTRLQVELLFPELQMMPIAQRFVSSFADLGDTLRVFFPDAGAAALARRDWGETPYPIRGLGELKAAIQPHEKVFLIIEPSSVEVAQVEKLCEEASERPVILLAPQMEDIATIGIGYAGRQLRERFLNQIESCYYLRPLDGAALFRCYPANWQVWVELDGEYQLVAEEPRKPVGDALEAIVMKAKGIPEAPLSIPRQGLFGGLKQFLKALNQ